MQRDDCEPIEMAQALASLLKEGYSTREVAKKIGKHYSYVSTMAASVELLNTLEKHAMKAEYYASDKKRESGEAIPVQHADRLLYRTPFK